MKTSDTDMPMEAEETPVVGTPITEDFIADSYDRTEDAHSLDVKIAKFREQEELFRLNRDREPLPEQEHQIYFFTGEPGVGKSLSALAQAYILRAYYGYEVVSTASFLIGLRIDVIDSLMYGETLGKKYVIFTDEAHGVVDRNADGAYRNRSAADSHALRRKNKHIIQLASMHERRVSPLVLDETKWLVRPEHASPANGSYALPPFCYRINRVAGPYPWQGKTRLEQLGFPRPGGKLKVRTKSVPAPLLYEASKLLNTAEAPELMASMNLNADKMRKAKAGELDEKALEEMLIDSLIDAWNDGWRPDGKSVDWVRVWRVAHDYGCPVEKKAAHGIFKETLEMTGTGRIKVANLFERYFTGG